MWIIIKVDVLIKIYNKIYNFGINIEIVNFFKIESI